MYNTYIRTKVQKDINVQNVQVLQMEHLFLN